MQKLKPTLKLLLKIICCLLLIVKCYLLNVSSVFAASTFSFGVFPPINEIIAKPGTKVSVKVRIFNYEEPSSIKIYPVSFKPADDQGNIEIVSAALEKDEALNWLTITSANEIFPGEINLNKDETRDFTLTFNISKAANEDDHYLTLFFESIPFGNDKITQSKMSARVGSLILLTVSQRALIPKYGEIIEFKAPQFVESGPVDLTLKVKNNGRTFFKPIGTVKIYDTFGKETEQISILPQNILAGGVRSLVDSSKIALLKEQNKSVLGLKDQKLDMRNEKLENERGSAIKNILSKIFSLISLPISKSSFTLPSSNIMSPYITFPQTFLIGRYTAVASFTLDEKGPTLTAKTTFYAFPVKIALAIIVVISLLLIIGKRLKTKP